MERFGPYQVEGELGRGGLGVVYRARDTRSGAAVALKVLTAGEFAAEPARKRLVREAQALGKLSHPHVVRLLEAGEAQGRPWLALELVDGEALEGRLQRGGPLPWPEAVRIGRALAQALAHSHAAGVLHRDVKPGNVLLRRDGTPLLTDFGLCRDLDPRLSRSALTRSGAFMGTPGYWSPEQARAEPVGPPSDVYGLGATLFALVTGRPPHVGQDLLQLLAEVEREPTAPRALRPELPAWLDALILRCLARDPAERPGLAELEAALTRGGGATRAQAAPRRAGSAPALAGAIVVLGGLGAAGLLLASRPSGAAAPTGGPPGAEEVPSAALGVPPAQVEPGLAPQQRFAAALETWDHGDYEQARSQLAGLLEEPGLSASQRALARGLLISERGSPEESAAALEPLPGEAPDQARAWMLRAVNRFGRQDAEGALADLTRAVELEPGLARAWHNRAVVRLVARADTEGALADLDRALALNTSWADTWFVRGRVRLDRGDAVGALADVTRALEMKPDAQDPWFYRALARIKLNDHQGALEDLDRFMKVRPNVPDAFHARGQALQALGREDEALADYSRAISSARPEGHLKAYASRAAIRERRGDTAGALDDLAQVLRLLPANSPLRAATEAAIARLRAGR